MLGSTTHLRFIDGNGVCRSSKQADKQRRRLLADLDGERAEQCTGYSLGEAERTAAPTEGQNLLQPADLGDASIEADARCDAIVGNRPDQRVAGVTPAARIGAAIETETGDFEDMIAARRVALA